jgi:hypothetical protein
MMGKNKAFSVTCFSILILLSGCMPKKDVPGGESVKVSEDVLVSQNGKPLLTVSEFQNFIKDAIGADPQMQFIAQLKPNFEELVFEHAKLREIVFNKWAEEAGVQKRAEYKKQKEQAEKALASMLNQQMFIKDHVGEVTEDQIRRYYDEKKNEDENLIISPAGVEAKGVKFDKEVDAKALLEEAKKAKSDFAAVAKNVKKDVEDFGLVTRTSFLDSATLKDSILNAKKVPSVLPVIKVSDNEFWVVKVVKREEVQYRPFDQAKEMIREIITHKAIENVFEDKIPFYIEKYGITINRAYFEEKQKKLEAEQQKMMEQMKESDDDKVIDAEPLK